MVQTTNGEEMTRVSEELTKIIIEELGVERGQVVPTADLEGDLNADLADIEEIVWRVEEKFGIEFPDGEAEQFTTVQAILDLLAEHDVTDETLDETLERAASSATD